MIRRTLTATAAAVVVLGATVTPAVAATTPAAVPAPTVAVTPAVALQVKYPGGRVATWCVPYRAGMSGADVLAVATPTYGTGPYAGFVLKITGQGTVPPTASKYWAYWRSPNGKPTGYTYSSSGVTSTRPAAGSVEAWVWNTGSSTTFPKRAYKTLCPNGA